MNAPETDPEDLPADRSLTQRQRDVLNCIDETIRVRGYPPSVREIGQATICLSFYDLFTKEHQSQKKLYHCDAC